MFFIGDIKIVNNQVNSLKYLKFSYSLYNIELLLIINVFIII